MGNYARPPCGRLDGCNRVPWPPSCPAENPAVDEVHCLAVRNATPLAQLAKTTKLIIHGGDLAKPDLGIEDEAEVESVFAAAQVLIHNGADTSFLSRMPRCGRPT